MIEQSIDNGLFKESDVKFPLKYYADILNKQEFRDTFLKFLSQYGYQQSIDFLARWKY